MSTDAPPQDFEVRPDTQKLAGNEAGEVDYEPHPENSIPLSSEQEKIVDAICQLYGAQPSEEVMQVYAEKAVYDDILSYADTRYKIAGQWYGLPKILKSSRILKREVVKATPQEIIFKLQTEYVPKVIPIEKPVNSLVSLGLDEHGKVKYHKDQLNEKDYSHEGISKLFKTLHGNHLTKVTQPPKSL